MDSKVKSGMITAMAHMSISLQILSSVTEDILYVLGKTNATMKLEASNHLSLISMADLAEVIAGANGMSVDDLALEIDEESERVREKSRELHKRNTEEKDDIMKTIDELLKKIRMEI